MVVSVIGFHFYTIDHTRSICLTFFLRRNFLGEIHGRIRSIGIIIIEKQQTNKNI